MQDTNFSKNQEAMTEFFYTKLPLLGWWDHNPPMETQKDVIFKNKTDKSERNLIKKIIENSILCPVQCPH